MQQVMASSGGSYHEIKHSLLKKKKLFHDLDFPAEDVSIGRDIGNVVWKRPAEILKGQRSSLKPLFIRNGATRADFDQGQLSDCWFIAASACLAVSNRNLFYNVIQPKGQSFKDGEYAGIFRFRFWRYGKWVEVVIDDYLPTVSGELVFAHNMEEPNEFWAPLMEKAYAKVHGSYESLEGGFMPEALVDFTGGISETYVLDDTAPKNLYDILYKAVRTNCMMGSNIEADQLAREASLSNGLYNGHAYSITAVAELKTSDGRRHKLVRLRNPWGWKEWNGDWSDRSSLWKKVDRSQRDDVDFTKLDDGEFWMSFDDWFQNFQYMDMCYLSPEELTDPLALDEDKTKWKTIRYEGRWERDVSAGGSGNPPHQALYWKNPQFKVNLTDKNQDSNGDCTMVVSLLELGSRKIKDIQIGIKIYRKGRNLRRGRNGERRDLRLKVDSGHSNMREVTARFTGKPGNYVIMPSTFKPNQEASFLLRIFTELYH
ncbi:calpain-A-like [Lineus longissimus]|uniref:calpain-A-like n=1 Tax=Lineus longissimus TaxID=88925 RepID=UPI002B4D8BE0